MAWFPTLNLSYNHSDNHILQLELSSDKTYPPYWSLNPSVYHFGAYGVAFGNPQLRPLKLYSAGLTYIYKQKYVIRPFINYITDYYTQLPYQSPDKLRQEFVMQNFDYRQNAGLMVVLPFNLGKKISSRFVANGVYLREKDETFYDIPFDRKTIYGVLQINSDIRFSETAKPEDEPLWLLGHAGCHPGHLRPWGVRQSLCWSHLELRQRPRQA